MKFEFPSFKYVIKALIIAFVLATIGYFVYPQLSSESFTAQRGFAYGILLGAVIGVLFTATRIKLAGSSKVESIFVGNLAFKTSAGALRQLFEEYGDVHAVRLMTDRATRRPRGFGFVEMPSRAARSAIKALDGTEFYGRELKVNLANERKPRPQEEA